ATRCASAVAPSMCPIAPASASSLTSSASSRPMPSIRRLAAAHATMLPPWNTSARAGASIRSGLAWYAKRTLVDDDHRTAQRTHQLRRSRLLAVPAQGADQIDGLLR